MTVPYDEIKALDAYFMAKLQLAAEVSEMAHVLLVALLTLSQKPFVLVAAQ